MKFEIKLDVDWNTVIRKKPLQRFYELYREGRNNEQAPQSYIDYFKASKFLLDELGEARADERRRIRKEISLILAGSPWLSKTEVVKFILNLIK